MEEQALRGAKRHDLPRAMPHELEAATIVSKAKIVDVAFLYLRERLEGKLRAQFVEVAESSSSSPHTQPQPLPFSHFLGVTSGGESWATALFCVIGAPSKPTAAAAIRPKAAACAKNPRRVR
jgi:hypothetical protein